KLAAISRCIESRLVHQVCESSPGESRRAACHHGNVYVIAQGYLPRMHLEDAFASTDVREWDHDLPVEPPRSQESGIKDVGPVAGRNENDAIIRLESVHLDQQLVQCLLTLVVTSAKTGATMPSHSIDLVDENDLLLLAGHEPGTALPKRECLVSAALHLPHQEDPEPYQQDERQPRGKKNIHEGRVGRLLQLYGHAVLI